MVYVSEDFLQSAHGKSQCVDCHNGNPSAFDKEGAHQGIVALPSDSAEVYCERCHPDIVSRYSNSLHYNQNGYFKRIESRAGFDIRNDPDLMEHYNEECGKCHATCGQCHVSRPVSVHGGFVQGHEFDEPDRDNNCVACHGSRVGAEYLGQNEGYAADLHRFKAGGGSCGFCHSGSEMHGSGVLYTYRYLNMEMPRCEDCHEDAKNANTYHEKHWASESLPSLSCHVCHSQPYKNCNGCHTGGSGITGSSYMKFKIAKNKFNLEAANRNYDYVTVRHIPIAPDTYASWGIANLANYNSEPTWKYTTPHNVQKWTNLTTVEEGQNCGDNCHNSTEYYLLNNDLLSYEIEANKEIVMDDKLQ
jgi:thiosulfate/3-mercaptopyruvate sulfurtransferase